MSTVDELTSTEREERKLRLLIENTRGFVLAFVLYDNPAERARAASKLQELLPLPLVTFTLGPEADNPFTFLRQHVFEQRSCVFFFDVEEALPGLLGWVNLHRESFGEFPHAILFWIREAGLRQLAEKAPDFWAWRSGVFDLREKNEKEDLLPELPLSFGRDTAPLSQLQARIGMLTRLADDERLPPEERAERAAALASTLMQLERMEEAARYCHLVLQLVPGSERAAHALVDLSTIAGRLGQHEQGEHYVQQALEIYRQSGNRTMVIALIGRSAVLEGMRKHFDRARKQMQEAMWLALEGGSVNAIAGLLRGYAVIEMDAGEPHQSRELLEKALALYQTAGKEKDAASIFEYLGILSENEGRTTEALNYYERARILLERWGPPRELARSLTRLGDLALTRAEKLANYERALSLYRDLRMDKEAAALERKIALWTTPVNQ